MLKYFAVLYYSTFLCYAHIVVTSSPSYDESVAYYLVEFAGISYCSDSFGDKVEHWSCDRCKRHPQVSYHKTFKASIREFTGMGGFLAYDNSTQKLILAVRGTDTIKLTNWIHNAFLYLKPYGRKDCHDCRIHAGFLHAYNSVKYEILALLIDAHHQIRTPITGIYITGHSLGAPIATLAAVDLPDYGYPIELIYTFGTPRIGNQAAATFISNRLPTNHWRITHRDDPIPHLGPKFLGYRQINNEVWYPKSPTGYFIVCNSAEDQKCEDGAPPKLYAAFSDHVDYMGFPFAATYLGCKFQGGSNQTAK